MADAFECGGLWASIIGVSLLAALSNYTMQMIVVLKNHIENHSDEWPAARYSMEDPLLKNNKEDNQDAGANDEDSEAITYMDIGKFAYGRKGEFVAQVLFR